MKCDLYLVIYSHKTTTAFETLDNSEKVLGVFTSETLPKNPKKCWNFDNSLPNTINYNTDYDIEETEDSITTVQFKLIKTKGYF